MLLNEFLANEFENIDVKNINKLSNKTIFITGGNGLIGSNLLSYLQYMNLKNNLNINFIVHSFSMPEKWLPQNDNIQYINSDLNNDNLNYRFDYLFHTATYGQPKKFIKNKLGTIKLNTETYIKLLEKAKGNNASVLYMSSSEVYGQAPAVEIPIKESYNGNVCTFADRAVYAESKRLAETISKIYIDEGVNIKLIRLAIAYGPGIKYSDSRFINEFVKKALNDGCIKMMDAGLAVRHLGFITDIVEMILNVAISGKESIYNIAGESQKTIFETAKMIAKYTNTKVISPKLNNSIQGTPLSLLLDTSLYKQEFNKKNFITYEQGLKKTVEWITMLHKKENA